MDFNIKREQIKIIRSNPELSEKEKNNKIQELMSNNYVNIIELKSNESNSCSHYGKKKCSKFLFGCCNLIDPCKRCHLERNCCNLENIKVNSITCNNCNQIQQPSNQCVNCKIKFSTSYCEECQIWTDKNIFHCVDCGLCRIGTNNTLTHCFDCNQCFINNTHTICSKKNYKNGICVVCSETTFDSQSNSILLSCNHFIHSICFDKLVKKSIYKCPHCKKSICDMTLQWNYLRDCIKSNPLPNDMFPIIVTDIVDTQFGKFEILSIETLNENKLSNNKLFKGKFINWFNSKSKKSNVTGTLNNSMVKKNIYKQIHCNDCEKKTLAPFHYWGMECAECKSFNTQE